MRYKRVFPQKIEMHFKQWNNYGDWLASGLAGRTGDWALVFRLFLAD